jgi:hypothetical protein
LVDACRNARCICRRLAGSFSSGKARSIATISARSRLRVTSAPHSSQLAQPLAIQSPSLRHSHSSREAGPVVSERRRSVQRCEIRRPERERRPSTRTHGSPPPAVAHLAPAAAFAGRMPMELSPVFQSVRAATVFASRSGPRPQSGWTWLIRRPHGPPDCRCETPSRMSTVFC